MDSNKIHCPHCQRVLRLPASAAGRHARCPACHEIFVVPQGKDLVEETISSWIEEDVQEMQDKHDQALQAAARAAAAEQRAQEEREAAQAARKDAEREAAEAAARMKAARTVAASQRTHPTPKPRIDPEARQTTERGTASDPIWASDTGEHAGNKPMRPQDLDDRKSGVPVINRAALEKMPTPHRRTPPTATRTSRDDSESRPFPQDLTLRGPVPHLVVHDVSQQGVVFAFDGMWLEHQGFRLSMPMECLFSGNSTRNELIARPLIFEDQCKALGKSRNEIEVRHEHHLIAGQTARDAMRSMDKLEWLPKPFNLPMPYYVDKKHTAHSVHAWTESPALGEITCFVQVVSGDYALHWLLRVNGATGPEYDLLERAVATMWSGPWADLTELTRSRLEVWCKFEPMEHFLLFLPDSDFSKADTGLGGLVLTDRRLIYCKFKHRGSFPLDTVSELHVKTERDTAELVLRHEDGRTRICKLHLADLPTLVDALADSTGMKMVVDEPEAQPPSE